MTAVPTSAADRHTAANDSIPMFTPCPWAIPAISRFELDPINVTDPAKVATYVIGSSTSRAGMRLVCSSCRAAGIRSATSGVVLISADATPR